ncbi:MAG: ATP-binding protein [Deltaproteobacteria bacterium]|nr:ATP-binding protein [Deltaproteobacteria bacterium]
MPKSEIKTANLLLQIIKEAKSDFSFVREAISNAFDARASRCHVYLTRNTATLAERLDVLVQDNGVGMSRWEEVQPSIFNFFNVADSAKAEDYNIGEKGIGTKLYFNSSRLEVLTKRPGEEAHYWLMDDPIGKINGGDMPEFNLAPCPPDIELMDPAQGTTVKITGLNVQSVDHFLYTDRRAMGLKDYVNFFTVAGNVRKHVEGLSEQSIRVNVYQWDQGEERPTKPSFAISEHIFPKSNIDTKSGACLPDPNDMVYHFGPIVMKLYRYRPDGSKEMVDIPITILGIIAGKRGHQVESGGEWYQGLFLAKDGFIIRRYNDVIGDDSWHHFRIIVNCQALELSIGRDDFRNTSSEVFQAIDTTLRDFFEGIKEWRLPAYGYISIAKLFTMLRGEDGDKAA